MNQYEDFPYQPKLRKYMSDPFGDYYYHHNSNYHGNQGHNYNNQRYIHIFLIYNHYNQREKNKFRVQQL